MHRGGRFGNSYATFGSAAQLALQLPSKGPKRWRWSWSMRRTAPMSMSRSA